MTTPCPHATAPPARLDQQLAFIRELDKLKRVLRQTRLMDGSRRENDAEHCWHLAMMALVLGEHAGSAVDLARVVKMLLLHDVVEIDAGDTFLYASADAAAAQPAREAQAAERIFGLLPAEQAAEFRALWEEFEARASDDAKFARALDRLQPLLHNHANAGGTWREFGITAEQVIAKKQVIAEGAPALWQFALRLIEESVRRGDLATSKGACA